MQKLLLILLCLPMIGFGQGWIQTYGTPAVGVSVQQTNDGGFIIDGHTVNNGTNSVEIYLMKTDSIGNMQWDNTFGGIGNFEVGFGHSVRQTNDGGYIISGQRSLQSGGLNFSDSSEVLLIKTDNLGIQQWQRFYGVGVVTNDLGSSVQQTTDGGYIIYAIKDAGEGGGYLWLIKTNSAGVLLWEKTYDMLNFGIAGHPFASFGEQTTDGGYILVGSGWGSGFTRPIKLIKTNSQGDTSWTQNISLPTNVGLGNHGISIRQTNNGGYVIAGFNGTLDTTAIAQGFLTDGLLIKADNTGSLVWDKTIGHLGYDAHQTTDGGYIWMGRDQDTTEHIMLHKTDANGNTIWTKTYTGSGNVYYNNFFIGNVEQTTDGGYITAGFHHDTINNANGVLLIKTDGNGNVTSTFNITRPSSDRKLEKIVDILGRETKGKKNKPLFYIFDDGTVEKRIIIE
ncbi:MAG: hypothetical protein VX347_00385 [Bacteroidota bacterium]|nr:hypothetical protein [Bacteroidota bacterium]